MSDQTLDPLDLQLKELHEQAAAVAQKKAQLEKLRIDKALADAAERRARLEREEKERFEEQESRTQAILKARAEKAALQVAAKKEEERQSRLLEEQAERLRQQEEGRLKKAEAVRKATQALYEQEQETKRMESELVRSSQPAPEPERPIDFSAGSAHPLARIIQGAEAANAGIAADGISYSASKPMPVPVQPAPASKKLLNPTSADVDTVLAAWPLANRPDQYVIVELVHEFPLEHILLAIKTFTHNWSISALNGNYAATQVRNFCEHQK
jgi:hypothetical protein